jgi:hypothetical protein
VTNPLFLAGVVIVAGSVGNAIGNHGVPWLILSYSLRASSPSRAYCWWLGAAWLTVGFLRAFVVLGRQPRESIIGW